MLHAPLMAESQGIGALGIDLNSLIVYLVNFAVLAIILYFFAYKRIIGVLDTRADRIRESLEEAERVRQESEDQQTALKQALDEGRQEGQRVLAEAREAAEKYRQQQQITAREEADNILSRARLEIEAERDSAIEQVRSEFAGLAITAAERVIRKSLDEDGHRDLIDGVLAEHEAAKGER